jgi:hypothetical protein
MSKWSRTFFKKSIGHLHQQGTDMRFQFIEDNRSLFPVTHIQGCQISRIF